MQVHYKKPIIERINDIIIEAKLNNKIINYIMLDDPIEIKEFKDYIKKLRFYSGNLEFLPEIFPCQYQGITIKSQE